MTERVSLCSAGSFDLATDLALLHAAAVPAGRVAVLCCAAVVCCCPCLHLSASLPASQRCAPQLASSYSCRWTQWTQWLTPHAHAPVTPLPAHCLVQACLASLTSCPSGPPTCHSSSWHKPSGQLAAGTPRQQQPQPQQQSLWPLRSLLLLLLLLVQSAPISSSPRWPVPAAVAAVAAAGGVVQEVWVCWTSSRLVWLMDLRAAVGVTATPHTMTVGATPCY